MSAVAAISFDRMRSAAVVLPATDQAIKAFVLSRPGVVNVVIQPDGRVLALRWTRRQIALRDFRDGWSLVGTRAEVAALIALQRRVR